MHPHKGGAEVYVQEIANKLIEFGNEVTLFTSGFPKCKSEEVIDDVKIIRAGNKYTVYYHAIKEYKKRFSKEKYDVIIECINTIPFLTPYYVNLPRVCLIFQLTGDVFKKILPGFISLIARYVETLIYTSVYKEKVTLVLSQSVKNELVDIDFNASNIYVGEPGINTDYYCPKKNTKYPKILYMNRIVPYKNVDHLIKAFHIVKRKISNVELHIAGCRGSSYENYLKKLVTTLSLDESTFFYEYVDGDLKLSLIQEAWLHVLPSTKEGWGISVLEAASCGVPTVAYDVVGLKSSVINGKTGLLVTLGDISALAEAISTVLMNEKLRMQMSENAREWALKYSWGRTAEIALNAMNFSLDNNMQ